MMPQRDLHPAELEDLDRLSMAEMSVEEYNRRIDVLNQIMADRWVAEQNARDLAEGNRKAANQRKAIRLLALWFLCGLALLALAHYLQSIGL